MPRTVKITVDVTLNDSGAPVMAQPYAEGFNIAAILCAVDVLSNAALSAIRSARKRTPLEGRTGILESDLTTARDAVRHSLRKGYGYASNRSVIS